MKHSLDHLPASKQKDLEHIVATLRDEFEQVVGFANGKKKHSRILKIILFGSHATGKWVNDPAHGYVSDYDILVILNNEDLLQEYKIWHTAEDRIALRVRPPLNILVHTLHEVNSALAEGQYFFTDIKREGIVLGIKGSDSLIRFWKVVILKMQHFNYTRLLNVFTRACYSCQQTTWESRGQTRMALT
jgi:predicted nucleotidyltransferase